MSLISAGSISLDSAFKGTVSRDGLGFAKMLKMARNIREQVKLWQPYTIFWCGCRLLLQVSEVFKCRLYSCVALSGCIEFQWTAKVGEGPTVRPSDTETDLPIVSADLFTNFRSYMIASSLKTGGFWSDTIASSIKICLLFTNCVASSLQFEGIQSLHR